MSEETDKDIALSKAAKQIKDLESLVEDYHRICNLLMNIHFHGNFKAYTVNEKELHELLVKNGYYAESKYEVIEKLKQSYQQKYHKQTLII